MPVPPLQVSGNELAGKQPDTAPVCPNQIDHEGKASQRQPPAENFHPGVTIRDGDTRTRRTADQRSCNASLLSNGALQFGDRGRAQLAVEPQRRVLDLECQHRRPCERSFDSVGRARLEAKPCQHLLAPHDFRVRLRQRIVAVEAIVAP